MTPRKRRDQERVNFALSELAVIVEFATEGGNWSVHCIKCHCESVNRQLATLVKYAEPIPEPITRNRVFLRVHGWKVP